jgi:hypothetical protein
MGEALLSPRIRLGDAVPVPQPRGAVTQHEVFTNAYLPQ